MNAHLDIVYEKTPPSPYEQQPVGVPIHLGWMFSQSGLHMDRESRRRDARALCGDPHLAEYTASHALRAAELRKGKMLPKGRLDGYMDLSVDDGREQAERALTDDQIAKTNVQEADFVEENPTQTTELAGLHRRKSRRTVMLEITRGDDLADMSITDDLTSGLAGSGLDRIRAHDSAARATQEEKVTTRDAYGDDIIMANE